MLIADIVVSVSVCCASPFECDGGGKVYSLCSRPFSFPQSHFQLAVRDVRFRIYLSAGASFCQATPDSFRSVCPPASWCLKIRFQSEIGSIRVP
jgi:hypothetical protein